VSFIQLYLDACNLFAPHINEHRDVVDANTLLLFEVLDNRTSLNMKQYTGHHSGSASPSSPSSASVRKPPKRIAWGYMVPVGTTGIYHVGVPDAFKTDEANKENDASSRQRKGRPNRRVETENEDDDNDDDDGAFESIPSKIGHTAGMGSLDVVRRLQLYSYTTYDGIVGSIQRAMMGWSDLHTDDAAAGQTPSDSHPNANTVCEVYLQWRRHRRDALHGSVLEVSLGPRFRCTFCEHWQFFIC
jgi:hypothetical protein